MKLGVKKNLNGGKAFKVESLSQKKRQERRKRNGGVKREREMGRSL